MKKALVFGAGGFIGSHMVKRLKREGYWVRGVDLEYPEFSDTEADEFIIRNLTSSLQMEMVVHDVYQKPFRQGKPFDEIYQFAADMGGAGYVFTGENDSKIMWNSAQINMNLCELATTEKIFYSSSACIYPQGLQTDYWNEGLKESDAYPANPDSEYGWEKLFSERLYQAFQKNEGLNVRIGRFHNIYGPEGTYEGGREKAPAAICRKASRLLRGLKHGGTNIEIWGTGEQTRSFLYIDDCIDAVRLLMESEYTEPLNIGSEESISINDLAQMVINASGKDLEIKNIDGPVGVNGRNSDNTLIKEVLNWGPKVPLDEGMFYLYKWIEGETKD